MLNSLGKELSKEDFLVSALGSQHVFVIIQASDTKRPLVVRWPDLLKAILAQVPSNPGGQSGVQVKDEGTVVSSLAQFLNFVGAGVTATPNGLGVDITIPGGAPGSAQWGSIGAGTGVGSQADLVAYLAANFYPLAGNPSGFITSAALAPYLTIAAAAATYYPLSNPSGFITAAALVPYLTSAIAASTYVPLSRTITINGVTLDLSANRSWTIPTGSGTVTSVGLSMPAPASPAFSVSGSPVTTNGTLTVTANGNANQVIDGTGALRTIDSISVVSKIYLQNTFVSGTLNGNVEYVSSVNKVYVTNQTTNSLTIFDATSGTLLASVTVVAAYKAKYIAVSNEIWVTSATQTTIARINVTTNAFIANITGATVLGFSFVEFSATKVFISNLRSPGSIMVVNPTTNTVDATITLNVPINPAGMVLNNNPSSAQNGFIVLTASGVAILDPTTNTITTTLTNPSSSIFAGTEIIYNTAQDRYYIASRLNSRIIGLDVASATTWTVGASIDNNLFVASIIQDTINDLLFFFPTSGGTSSSTLIKIYKLSTLEPIFTIETPCFTSVSEAGYSFVDILNKRIFLVGRNTSANGCVAVYRYL